MSGAALAVEGVTKTFGGVIAVDHVSIDAPTSLVTGLIGPNGSGKSTLLNVLSGQYRPDHGAVYLFGEEITNLRPELRAELGLARMFQQPRLVEEITPLENIALGTWARRRGALQSLSFRRGRRARRTAAEAAEAVGVTHLLGRQTKDLSHVERRMLEMARVIVSDARVLLLDEPTAGLDRGEKERILDQIRSIALSDKTILIVEHDVTLIADVCDLVHCLARGALLTSGTPAEVTSHSEVRRLYLGTGTASNRSLTE